jgi:hypothetical protein
LNSPWALDADVLGEGDVDEDVDRGEEERVADPVQDLHRDDGPWHVGQQGEDREAGRRCPGSRSPVVAATQPGEHQPRIAMVRISAIWPIAITNMSSAGGCRSCARKAPVIRK